MGNGIVWYGERGVVNALVTDLALRGDSTVPGVQALLRAVTWAVGSPPRWVEQVTEVTFFVELGMRQFGNPDLILACSTRSTPSPRVVFIESKVVPYLESAMSNAGSMAVEGYNSSINGQIVLKHRLARALRRWDTTKPTLAEPSELHEVYQQPADAGGLGDPANSPRHLDKPSVLEIIRQHGLHGPEPDRYYFVAWTWDRLAYFATNGAPADLHPLFLLPGGANAWEEMKPCVGWLGYRQVKEAVVPGPAYVKAIDTMLRQLEPPDNSPEQGEGENLTTVNFSRFGPTTLGLLAEVEDEARDHFGPSCVERKNGSSSVRMQGQVRVKIVPQRSGADEYIMLGIRSTLAPQGWCPPDWAFTGPLLAGVGGNRRAFLFHRLPAGVAEASAVARELFQLLQDRFRGAD
jgi:hypothetical protein